MIIYNQTLSKFREDVTMNMMNIILLDELRKKGYEDEDLKNSQIFNTPTVLITKEGKIKAYLSGAHELNEYIEFFKKNKAIE